MKPVPMISGLAAALVLAGCAQISQQLNQLTQHNGATVVVPNPQAAYARLANPADLQQPHVAGSLIIRQRVALPADAVITVTLADATRADAPSVVLSQKVVHSEGNQAPFNFVLPYKLSDIRQNARIVLSAAVTVNGQLAFVTDNFSPVVTNGINQADITLVPTRTNTLVEPQSSTNPEAWPAPKHFLQQSQ